MNRGFYIAVLASALLLAGCEKFELEGQADTFFHVSVEGTELPVWVRGNTASKKLMVYINGGPGLTSIDVAQVDLFGWKESLEKEVAVVYYDQRGCGNAQGNLDESTITIAQYVEDLDAIVSVLQSEYAGSEIYLCGHSFGAFVGANYLLSGDLQNKIAGWITVDGAYNFDYDLSWQYRRAFLINVANEEIAKGNDVQHWTEALVWCDENPVITEKKQKDKLRSFIGEPGERIVPEELPTLKTRDVLGLAFTSSYNPLPAYSSSNLEQVNDLLNDEVEGINLMSQVYGITLPTVFLWGRYDDLITPEEGMDVFKNIGTDSLSKTFVLLPDASHEPMIGNPEAFEAAVLEFVLD